MHTPGPWRVTDDHKTRRVIKGADGHSIVIVESWTREEDAHLLAAAPSLLAALQAVLSHVEDTQVHRVGGQCTLCHTYRDIARAAIAKARNEGADHHARENVG